MSKANFYVNHDSGKPVLTLAIDGMSKEQAATLDRMVQNVSGLHVNRYQEGDRHNTTVGFPNMDAVRAILPNVQSQLGVEEPASELRRQFDETRSAVLGTTRHAG